MVGPASGNSVGERDLELLLLELHFIPHSVGFVCVCTHACAREHVHVCAHVHDDFE